MSIPLLQYLRDRNCLDGYRSHHISNTRFILSQTQTLFPHLIDTILCDRIVKPSNCHAPENVDQGTKGDIDHLEDVDMEAWEPPRTSQSPEETSPEQQLPNQMPPELVSPEGISSGQTSPEQTSPELISPEQTPPEQTSPEQILPKEIVPDGTQLINSNLPSIVAELLRLINDQNVTRRKSDLYFTPLLSTADPQLTGH
jgi:hypothetical protein